ncbi:unnamed protein product [Toxocara canis]|uniref:EB domain-containing protein n=1 Tax=Toxocara canis TaxID=6265 RepID=A0A183UHH8_TOXCA|nr:unnamed protein product [Toxocara canis]
MCTYSQHCRIGYECKASGVCCAHSSQCPSGFVRVNDRFGRLISCSMSGVSDCPSGSICKPSSSSGETLCCRRNRLQYSDMTRSYRNPAIAGGCSSRCFSSPDWIAICSYVIRVDKMHALMQHRAFDPIYSTSISYTCEEIDGNDRMACCPTLADANTFQCSMAMHVPSMSGRQNVFCSTPSRTNECPPGYACTRSANDFSLSLCCSVQSSPIPVCPGQQKLLMEDVSPYYCTPNEQVPCPVRYLCKEAINQPGTFVCCTSPTSSNCPPNFAPSLDAAGHEASVSHGKNFHNEIIQIYCTPNQPSTCPGYSMCLQSSISPNMFLCCKSRRIAHVCPNNQHALLLPNAQVETCAGPGAPCSQRFRALIPVNYRQHFQHGYAAVSGLRWLFVRMEEKRISKPKVLTFQFRFYFLFFAKAHCARDMFVYAASFRNGTITGSDTVFSVSGQTFSCQPLAQPTGCPIHYDCSRSSTDDIYVCCQQTTASKTTTTSAPITLAVECPTGWNPFRSEIDGSYRFCENSFDMTYLVGVYVCCSEYVAFEQSHVDVLKEIRCLSDNSVPAIQDDSIRYCTEANRSSAFDDFRSHTHALLNKVCGSFGAVYRRNGRALECTDDTNICPEGSSCQPSLTNTRMYCCEEAKCPSGLESMKRRQCDSQADCPQRYKCLQSVNVRGLHICCAVASAQGTRCLSGRTQISSWTSVACTDDSVCKKGFKCSTQTTTGERACCEEHTPQIRICPHNREPYRDAASGKLRFCNETENSCPNGYFCKRAFDSRQAVCCSPIAFCSSQSVPLIDPETNHAKRCFAEGLGEVSRDDCSPGYICRQSSVSYLKVCCRDLLISRNNDEHDRPSADDNSQ